MPKSIHKIPLKPYLENKKSDLWLTNLPFASAVKNTTQTQSSSNWILTLNTQNPQFSNSDISAFLCLILLQHLWFESLFHRQSFAIACFGNTFNQRILRPMLTRGFAPRACSRLILHGQYTQGFILRELAPCYGTARRRRGRKRKKLGVG